MILLQRFGCQIPQDRIPRVPQCIHKNGKVKQFFTFPRMRRQKSPLLSATLNDIRFVFYHNIKDNERNLCQDLLTIENRLRLESARAALCKRTTCTRQTFLSKTFANWLNMQKQYKKMFRKRVMTRIRCR